MLEERLTEHREKMRKLLPALLLKELQAQFRAFLTYIHSYEEASNELIAQLKHEKKAADSPGLLTAHIDHRKKLLELLNAWVNKRRHLRPKDAFAGYDDAFGKILHELPTHWQCTQAGERFRSIPGDNKLIQVIKAIKSSAYATQLFLHKIINAVRTKTGKIETAKPVWKQKIPIRKLTAQHYENSLLLHFSAFSDEKMKTLALLAHDIWRADDALFGKLEAFTKKEIDRKELLSYFEQGFLPVIHQTKASAAAEKNSMRPLLMDTWKDIDHAFSINVQLAGTLEMPGFLYPKIFLKHKRTRLRGDYARQIRRRTNTLFALADDWKFNQEIYILTVSALKTKTLFRQTIQERGQTATETIQTITAFLRKSRSEIGSSTISELNKKLQQLKYNAGKDLHNTIIPKVTKTLYDNAFPELVIETKNELIQILSSKTRKRILIKDFDPGKAYSDKSLEAISLLELLEFDVANKLEKAMHGIRLQGLTDLDDFRNRLQDIGRMALFNLDAALLMAEKQKDSGPEDIIAEAKAGMQRAIDRHKELEDAFRQFLQKLINDFDIIIEQFNN